MDTTFYNLIYSLMSYGGLTAGAETAGSQREWMLPTGLAADPAGYAPATLANLAQLGYSAMTPIQAASLPIALAGSLSYL